MFQLKDFQEADKSCRGNVVQGFIELENLKKQGVKGKIIRLSMFF